MLDCGTLQSAEAKSTVYCFSFASPFSWFCTAINFVLDNMVVLVFLHLNDHVFAKRKIYANIPGLQRGLALINQGGQVGMQHSLASPKHLHNHSFS